MYQLLPFPMTELACLLLLIYLLWTRRLRRHHPQRSQLPPPANPPPTPHEKSNAKNNNLSPKVHLLRSKLALAMQNASPIYSEIKSKHPDALIEPWSARMSGPPYTHVGKNDYKGSSSSYSSFPYSSSSSILNPCVIFIRCSQITYPPMPHSLTPSIHLCSPQRQNIRHVRTRRRRPRGDDLDTAGY